MRKYRYSNGSNLCVLEQIFIHHFGAILTALEQTTIIQTH